jgi:hypothetical protein
MKINENNNELTSIIKAIVVFYKILAGIYLKLIGYNQNKAK